MWQAFRSLFAPDPDRPRRPSVGDRALAIGFAILAIVETALRDDLSSRGAALAPTLAVVAALAVRRVHPFAAHTAAFGITIAASLLAWATHTVDDGLVTQAAILLMPYALVRWASGRAIAVGLVLMAMTYALSALEGQMRNAEEWIGSAVVLSFPALLGATVRFRADAHRRELVHAQMRERGELARELHDTVAHHVSAIAIQAQGARAVLASRPEAAATALEAIEAEAARALSELRTLVRSLREDGPPELAPRATLADLERAIGTTGDGPTVAIERVGRLDGLPAVVEAALVRVTQESITNVRRHARNATRIDVRIAVERDSVHLTIHDDGDPPAERRRSGFGLVGMAERASLLGGTLVAGPSVDRGWTVEAVLPVEGAAR